MTERVFTRKVRELRSLEEFKNVLKSYHRDQFVILERSCDPITFQPTLVFMVKREAGMNEFYSVVVELTPPGTVQTNSFFKKKTFFEKVKDFYYG